MHLRVLKGSRSLQPSTVSLDPPPFTLSTMAGRPGQGRDPLLVPLDETTLLRVAHQARSARVPIELWIRVWVESQRAVFEAVSCLQIDDERELVAALDGIADARIDREFHGPRFLRPPAADRLASYAKCVALGDPAVSETGGLRELQVGLTAETYGAWHTAAAHVGQRLSDWVVSTSQSISPGRQKWEAAAALDGNSLAEWVLIHAARCARR